MTAPGYHARVAGIRYALDELHDTQQIADLPPQLVDLLFAAVL